MKNDFRLFNLFTIHGYGLMIAIGILSAYLTTEYRAKKKGMKYELIFNLAIWCVIGGILGAKLLFLITQIKSILSNPASLLDISEGFVVYGGIIGGIFAGFLFCKKHQLEFLKYFDLVMPSIALAQGFGRIGCLLAGCCYGVRTDSAFSIVFPENAYAPAHVHLIPTQPISSALDFLHFFVLVLLSKRTKADGQIAGFYLIFYSIGRFILEFFRGDLERGSIAGISTSQFISIFLLLAGICIVIIRGLSVKRSSKNQNS